MQKQWLSLRGSIEVAGVRLLDNDTVYEIVFFNLQHEREGTRIPGHRRLIIEYEYF